MPDEIEKLAGVGEKTALDLYQAGFRSAGEIADASVEDLMMVDDMEEEKAGQIIAGAVDYVESQVTGEPSEAIDEEKDAEEEMTDGEE